MARYLQIKSSGWTKDEFGYHIYARYDFEGSLIVVPGIILRGERRKAAHKGYDVTFTKEQIEAFVSDISDFERDAFERASQDINMLVHDLRHISNNIYNSALEADVWINRGNLRESKVRVQNVIASQSLLKIRTDVLDFLGNPASIIKSKSIEVYRKVDKVSRSLKPEASKKKVSIYFSGSCHLSASGPDIFEVIPFVILENAIKYSPEGADITVEVSEIGQEISLKISSLGPFIYEDEREAIFQKGVRGQAAQDTALPGSGFGLFLLRSLVVDHFAGRVEVAQDETTLSFNSIPMYPTTFTVLIPGMRQAGIYGRVNYGR